MAPPRPNKKDVMLALLEQSGVFVHLDPRTEGVVVPDGFRRQPELVLQFGLNMAVAIKDLEVDDEAVSGTLSFARRPFWVKVPWDAIYALVSDEDQRGMVWPEDAPRESKLSQGAPRAAEKPKFKLRAVGPDDQAPEPEAEADEDDERDGVCAQCSTPWLGGGSHCAVCGASRREAFRAGGDDESADASEGEDAADAGLGFVAMAPAPGPSQSRKRPSFSVVPPAAEDSSTDQATGDGARSGNPGAADAESAIEGASPDERASDEAQSEQPSTDEPSTDEPSPDEPSGGKAKKRPSHLRLVK